MEIIDPADVDATGDGLEAAEINRRATFNVNIGRNGSSRDLKVQIRCMSSKWYFHKSWIYAQWRSKAVRGLSSTITKGHPSYSPAPLEVGPLNPASWSGEHWGTSGSKIEFGAL